MSKSRKKANAIAPAVETIEMRVSNQNQVRNPPVYFYLILITIPIFFFLFLEIFLRVVNFGNNYPVWIEQNYHQLTLNPEIAKRYFFNSETVPTPNGDKFDKVKKENCFRVFILGESSAAGYPYLPNGSLAQFIRKKLDLSYPEKKIEVVNLGLTAINTFTIKDLLPDVLENKPDLLIIYTGHNEFYGALGVASSESVLSSPTLTDLLIKFRSYRTIQLINNFVSWISELFSKPKSNKPSRESLMAKMIGNELIELNSIIYKKGVAQFETNMKDILALIKNADVMTIIGTPVSNLLQKPFYLKEKENPSSTVYDDASKEIANKNYAIAKSLLIKARDNDVIRFRAPSEFTDIVKNLGKEYSFPIINFDSVFAANSPEGIVGYNLMVDHLHPTITGYWLMGKVFTDKILKMNLLPAIPSVMGVDAKILNEIKLVPLDSIIADIRVNLLINSYPFCSYGTENKFRKTYRPVTTIDTIAAKVLDQTISWEQAHQLAAEYYLKNNDLQMMIREVNTILEHDYYNQRIKAVASDVLIQLGMFDEALTFLNSIYKTEPDAYSTKWLGSIFLTKGNYLVAKKYLEESLQLNPKDQQTIYNLAGVQFNLGEKQKAIELLKKCLSINPNYSAARNFYNQLIDSD